MDNPPPKIALFGERTYKMRRAHFPVRAERVEFSRKSQVCLNIIFARKEGRTDPQAGAIKAVAKMELYFMVLILQGS